MKLYDYSKNYKVVNGKTYNATNGKRLMSFSALYKPVFNKVKIRKDILEAARKRGE